MVKIRFRPDDFSLPAGLLQFFQSQGQGPGQYIGGLGSCRTHTDMTSFSF